MTDKILSAYGIWEVTTEDDVEGRSIRRLGTHEGYLDEIAFALADQCYYVLNFKPAQKLNMRPSKTSVLVSVSGDAGSYTGFMDNGKRQNFFTSMLSGRPVTVTPGNYYGSVRLTFGKNKAETDDMNLKIAQAKALAKLTAEDRKILGLE